MTDVNGDDDTPDDLGWHGRIEAFIDRIPEVSEDDPIVLSEN
jgi:hypothetical protein